MVLPSPSPSVLPSVMAGKGGEGEEEGARVRRKGVRVRRGGARVRRGGGSGRAEHGYTHGIPTTFKTSQRTPKLAQK